MEEQFSVETPESVSFNYTLAGIGSRYLAALIDHLLVGVMLVLLYIAVSLSKLYDGFSILTALGILASFVVLFGYFAFFETVWRGQTPGKRAMNLRVLMADGLPIGFSEAMLRNIVRFVDFLPASYGLGLMVMFFDRRWRRLGDMAANTVVVRENAALRLEQIAVKSYQAPVAQSSYQSATLAPLVYRADRAASSPGMLPSGNPAIPNIERLSSSEYQLVRDYIMRRPALSWPRQQQLDHTLTTMVARKVQPPFPIHQPIYFLYQTAESYEMAQLR